MSKAKGWLRVLLEDIYRKDPQRAWKLALRIPVEKLEVKPLLEAMGYYLAREWRALIRELALRVPVQKLEYGELRAYLESEDDDVWMLALELGRRIPPERLNPYELIEEHEVSLGSNQQELARELVFRIPAEQFDYGKLCGYLRSGDGDVRGLAEELALKNFPNELSWETLVGFGEYMQDEPLCDVYKIMLSRFPEKFGYEKLIEFQMSGDKDIRKLAYELALEIPAKKLEARKLIAYQEEYGREEDVHRLATDLLQKIVYQEDPGSDKDRAFLKKYFGV